MKNYNYTLPGGEVIDLTTIAGVNTNSIAGKKFKVEIIPTGAAEQAITVIMDEAQMRMFSKARGEAQESLGKIEKILSRQPGESGGRNNSRGDGFGRG